MTYEVRELNVFNYAPSVGSFNDRRQAIYYAESHVSKLRVGLQNSGACDVYAVCVTRSYTGPGYRDPDRVYYVDVVERKPRI